MLPWEIVLLAGVSDFYGEKRIWVRILHFVDIFTLQIFLQQFSLKTDW